MKWRFPIKHWLSTNKITSIKTVPSEASKSYKSHILYLKRTIHKQPIIKWKNKHNTADLNPLIARKDAHNRQRIRFGKKIFVQKTTARYRELNSSD